jgi:glycosyltransferase involved in cell wall biosynthesis
MASSRLPLELAMEDGATVRRAFESWRSDAYDVAWFSKAATYELLGRPRLGPTIVDLDDLEDEKIRSRLAALRSDRGPGGRARATRFVAEAQATLNAGRWSRFQKSVAGDVDRVVLCSELDAGRSDLPNVTVVPNGYDAPPQPLGHDEVASPSTLLLAGSFSYPPNADAAHYFVSGILPLIRQRRSDVRLRLVGEPTASVTGLAHDRDVTVVGWVPDMDVELARADVAVVPLRYGSGTRVKILEAAAHRIPIVSTTLGAEGLGFEDGRHLLLADEPQDFAAACIRILEDPELRRHLVDEAEKAFLARFQWKVAGERIRELARSVAHQSGEAS